MAEKESINHIEIGDGKEHPIDALYLGGKEESSYQRYSNLVTKVDEHSTDNQYPSASCVYGIIGDLDSLTSN